ncbi:hypothetical protein NG788_07715 [Aliarcobacter cryaerophilus]|uniref:hypothetical protein n=1 Tax=Aliarcobacter cryaerophilus TaxID=28198 RepID=UPI003DA39803
MILDIINKLSQKYTFLQSIFIDEQLVKKANSDNEEYNNLPYHYLDGTYGCYVEKFKKSLSNANS